MKTSGSTSGPHLQAAVEQALMRQEMQHMAGEAADGALLDGDQHLVLARQPADQILVERLGEARIGDRGRKPGGVELLGREQAILQPRAEGQQRDLGAFA